MFSLPSVYLLNANEQVEQAEGGFDMNLAARAEPGRLADCAVALAGVANITVCTAESVSPGTDIDIRYLSPSQVSTDVPWTVAYTAEKVIRCYNEKRDLMHGDVTDNPAYVMVVLRAAQV